MIDIDTWGEFKQIVVADELSIKYVETPKSYHLRCRTRGMEFYFNLVKQINGSASKTDFEDNFKAGGNVDTKSVTTFVSESQSSKLILAKNNNRVDFWLINTSSNDLYFSYDSGATEDSIKLKKGSMINIKDVKGDVFAVWKRGADEGVKVIETFKV